MTIKMAFMTFFVLSQSIKSIFTTEKQTKIFIDENRIKQTTRNETFINFKKNKK